MLCPQESITLLTWSKNYTDWAGIAKTPYTLEQKRNKSSETLDIPVRISNDSKQKAFLSKQSTQVYLSEAFARLHPWLSCQAVQPEFENKNLVLLDSRSFKAGLVDLMSETRPSE